MKTKYLFMPLLFAAFTSCFDDEGNYDYNYKDENNISIMGLKQSYLAYSYIGEKLEIPITVETGAQELDYAWYVWDATENNSTSGEVQEKHMELISTDKDLSYEVNLPPRNYKLMVEAKNSKTGYAYTEVVDLEVSTTFLRGFYILKETPDGNSELDFYQKDNEPLVENLFASTGQKAMEGKPLYLGIVYDHGYMNKETNQVSDCNTLAVTTDKKAIAFFSTEDIKKLHDNSDVVYGGLQAGETPYCAFNIPFANCFLSNRGATISYPAGVMESFGTFGTQAGSGASLYATLTDGEGHMMYWNEKSQCVDYVFGMWMGPDGAPYDNGEYPTEGMECLTMGANTTTSKGYFVLKDVADKRYLYEADVTAMTTVDRVELASDSKFANATHYATNMWTSAYMYYVYNNQVYAYNLPERNEGTTPFTLQGMGGDEEITYLSYMFIRCEKDEEAGLNFTYLVVGTQEADNYKVYMYDIVAGEPKNLVRTIEGKGKLHSVKYVTPQLETNKYSNYDLGSL